MTACHGCNERSSQSAAKSAWEPGDSGTVFVFNYPARTLKKYYVYYEWLQVDPYQRVPIKRVRAEVLSSGEREYGQNIVQVFNNFKERSLTYEVYQGALHTDIVVSSSPYGNNAYDFVRSSQMRDELFDTQFRLGYNRVSTLVNRITSALNIKRFAILSEKFDFNIIFPDGSYVKVEPILHRQTYNIVEVKDGDGNTIPVTPPNTPQYYHHRQWARYENFKEYMSELGLRMRQAELSRSCPRIKTTCSISSDNSRMTCLAVCS
ncbi:hypothetical protein B1L02_07445 [Pseudoalteromonas piscicida]|uniref:Uncharacterized protein n=1 Tax=Pseudoalteromonas piscicida TaxID=43662 RepID=A0AAD0W3M3_PSEO7|nr:hypothetical protein B1L02_07445 [Pseudoalteromonas piscicida]AXR02420.1 hypothetical protein D0511_10320 [Pseudoalteromonas piscicida]